jgi:hypothetical protein
MTSGKRFEWDDTKAASNFAKHGVEFEFAVRIFLDRTRADFDVSRALDGERRRKAVGIIDGELFTLVYTERQSAIRIISARRSNVKEERVYASVYPRSEEPAQNEQGSAGTTGRDDR